MASSRKLTMNRHGEFRIRATGPNHCGVLENLEIKYSMECICDVALDDRGFLFDQVNVDNYFKSIRKSTLSCERLVMSCAKTLLRKIRLENPRCKIRKMSLTLAPAPFMASMTYDWVAPVKARAI